MKQRIIVIAGPTASSKSDLAIQLAKKFDGEIVSADSRQVYRGMDIGTGKVSKKEQRLICHHLIDVTNPEKRFSVTEYMTRAVKAMADIAKKKKIPIIVGGTGLYIDSLIYDLRFPEVKPNSKLRSKLEKKSVEVLFKQLRILDPQRAATIERKNKRRIIRALEILWSGQKIPVLNTKYHEYKSKYDVLWIGLKPNNLESKIEKRLKRRLRAGMIAEVRRLKEGDLSWKRLEEFGLEYKWISRFLQKQISKNEMFQFLLRDIVRYSKRQMTWFKRNKKIRWFEKPNAALQFVDHLL